MALDLTVDGNKQLSVPFMSWCSNWAGRSGRIGRGQTAVRPPSAVNYGAGDPRGGLS